MNSVLEGANFLPYGLRSAKCLYEENTTAVAMRWFVLQLELFPAVVDDIIHSQQLLELQEAFKEALKEISPLVLDAFKRTRESQEDAEPPMPVDDAAKRLREEED